MLLKMKRVWLSCMFMLLLVGFVSADFGNYLLADNPYISEPSFFEKLFGETFTIAAGVWRSVEVGDSFLIGVDEVALEACSRAGLTLEMRDGAGKIVSHGQGYLVESSVSASQRMQDTFTFTVPSGYADGTWTLKSGIYCLTTSELISKQSTASFVVGKASTCEVGWVGNAFCDRTANVVLRPYRDCLDGVEIFLNKEVRFCSGSEICDDGACSGIVTGEDKVASCGERDGDVCSSGEECSSEFMPDLDRCCRTSCYTPEGAEPTAGECGKAVSKSSCNLKDGCAWKLVNCESLKSSDECGKVDSCLWDEGLLGGDACVYDGPAALFNTDEYEGICLPSADVTLDVVQDGGQTKQIALNEEQIGKATPKQLAGAACNLNSECDNGNCVSMLYLESQGVITQESFSSKISGLTAEDVGEIYGSASVGLIGGISKGVIKYVVPDKILEYFTEEEFRGLCFVEKEEPEGVSFNLCDFELFEFSDNCKNNGLISIGLIVFVLFLLLMMVGGKR